MRCRYFDQREENILLFVLNRPLPALQLIAARSRVIKDVIGSNILSFPSGHEICRKHRCNSQNLFQPQIKKIGNIDLKYKKPQPVLFAPAQDVSSNAPIPG